MLGWMIWIVVTILILVLGTQKIRGDDETTQNNNWDPQSFANFQITQKPEEKRVFILGPALMAVEVTPVTIRELTKEECGQYNVDWKFIFAIGNLESAGYQKYKGQYNFYGRKAGRLDASTGEWRNFSSIDDAIENECRYIREQYSDKGFTTVEQIGHKYAENPAWAANIRKLMDQL